MAVWKIGSRWGNNGTSVLDLFLNYECVFFGECDNGQRLGDWKSVEPNDYFLITDGTIPVAIGKSSGVFQDYEHSKISFIKKHKDEFIYDQVRLCPASIVILPIEDQNSSWCPQGQSRFCRYHQWDKEMENRVVKTWEELHAKQVKSFSIEPRTVSLFNGKHAIFSNNVYYRIPKYQRAYSWGENELRRLMESLRDAMQTDESVFMGTMQLSEPIPLSADQSRIAYNVIDGQQRVTTFFILVNLLERLLHISPKFDDSQKSSVLQTWVSCGEEQLKLEKYLDFLQSGNDNIFSVEENNRYLQNHFLLRNLLDEYFKQEKEEDTKFLLEKLYKCITDDRIMFVVIETHAGLSKTLKIFNTINTSGLSLGTEDIFKIRFYEYLKSQGEPESVFDQISEVYAKIEEYNRNQENILKLSIGDILASCQRILIARENLSDSVFSWSYETFFECLFDTLLGIRTYSEFKSLQNRKILTVKDLNCIIDCYKENFGIWNKNVDFKIARNMIWETRYGFIWDLPIIARFFETISREQISDFTWMLFKFLCPPSLNFAKTVSPVRSSLIGILKKLPTGDSSILFPNTAHPDKSAEQMLDEAFEYQIAWYPKWKNLICRLVEYLKSPEKDEKLYERLWSSTDIEHIQCFTDEKDCEGVRAEWGDEINKLGNLALLESSLNRSINNHHERKQENYRKSQFAAIHELADKVTGWSKVDAEERRKENSKLLKDFLLK